MIQTVTEATGIAKVPLGDRVLIRPQRPPGTNGRILYLSDRRILTFN